MKNDYIVLENEVIIQLNRKKGQSLEARIDIEDFEKVDAFPGTWCALWNSDIQNYYCAGRLLRVDGRQTTVALHRWVMDAPDDMQVDHRDGKDTLNNRRDNLRIATRSENQQNRGGANRNSKSGIRGVSWSKRDRKWQATIGINGQQKHLGYFHDIHKAEATVIYARAEMMPFSKDAQELKEVQAQ